MVGDNSQGFDAFVKREQVLKQEEEAIDWAAERDAWLANLRKLYAKIESFLSKYIEAGEITREYRDRHLNEEYIGAYTAPMMILMIGRRQITLTPVGTFLVGTKGRVDVSGPAGKTRFLLVNRDATKMTFRIVTPGASTEEEKPQEIHWTWKIATNPPNVRFIDLTQESLFQALLEVANG